MTRIALCWLALALAAPARAAAPPPVALTVFAAASLSEPFTELGARFERAHPGIVVRFSFAGSQQLALQLAQGAVADVFASADERWMRDAVANGRVQGAPRPFARNHLVAIVPATNPARLHGLPDFARSGVKLVIAADAVPAGRYARRAIAALARQPGFPAGYERRVLANVVSEEDNVKAVAGKVRLGEADAGFVYRSDVTGPIARFVRVFDLPGAADVIAAYPVALVRDAPQPAAAQAFVDLLCSPDGQVVLERHGFSPLPSSPATP